MGEARHDKEKNAISNARNPSSNGGSWGRLAITQRLRDGLRALGGGVFVQTAPRFTHPTRDTPQTDTPQRNTPAKAYAHKKSRQSRDFSTTYRKAYFSAL